MAMQLKPKGAKTKAKFSQNLIIIGLVIALILTVIVTNYVSSAAVRDTVEIVVLKESLPKGAAITSMDQFEKSEMVTAEYQKLAVTQRSDGTTRREVLTVADAERMISKGGAYAGVYISAGRPVYYADLTSEASQKNSYLYTMDGELCVMDISLDDFENLIVPGDKINVRLTYDTTDYTLPTSDEYKNLMENGVALSNTITKTDLIFSEVSVLDMWNSSGDSIFDIYYELLTYPDAQRTEILNSSDFASKIKPTNLVLSVTSEEAERYAKLKSTKGEYLVTLLPRDGTTEILDALDELKIGFKRDGN